MHTYMDQIRPRQGRDHVHHTLFLKFLLCRICPGTDEVISFHTDIRTMYGHGRKDTPSAMYNDPAAVDDINRLHCVLLIIL